MIVLVHFLSGMMNMRIMIIFRDEEEEAYRLLTSMLKLLHILINRQEQQYKQATVVIHFELKCQ